MGRSVKRQRRRAKRQRKAMFNRIPSAAPPRPRPEVLFEHPPGAREVFAALGAFDEPTPAALPKAPQVAPAAAAEAARRLAAWLEDHPTERREARAAWAGVLEDAHGPARGMLLRLIDDWRVCDVGWPHTVAAELAQAAGAAGEGDVAVALRAMHASHLHGWQITGDDWDLDDDQRPPQVFELTRMGSLESVWAHLPGLAGPPDLFIHLAARLWPAGDGTWHAAPGLLPFAAEAEFEPPPPDTPGAGRTVVESAALTWAQAWQAGRAKVAACEGLLPQGVQP